MGRIVRPQAPMWRTCATEKRVPAPARIASAQQTRWRRSSSRDARQRLASGDCAPPGDEPEPERRPQPAAPRQVLLGRHHRRERQHPADVARADDEHHEHQRPAAADAEEAVVDAEAPRLALRRAPVPARRDEAERRVALLEAAVLERAELERARAGEHDRAERPTQCAASRRHVRATAAHERVGSVRDASPNANHAAKNPATTSADERAARPRVRATIRRNSARSGYVVGSIIAAIISTQASACSDRGNDDRPCGTARHSAATRARSLQPPCAT